MHWGRNGVADIKVHFAGTPMIVVAVRVGQSNKHVSVGASSWELVEPVFHVANFLLLLSQLL